MHHFPSGDGMTAPLLSFEARRGSGEVVAVTHDMDLTGYAVLPVVRLYCDWCEQSRDATARDRQLLAMNRRPVCLNADVHVAEHGEAKHPFTVLGSDLNGDQ